MRPHFYIREAKAVLRMSISFWQVWNTVGIQSHFQDRFNLHCTLSLKYYYVNLSSPFSRSLKGME